MPSADDNDGFMDRLAKLLFASLNGPFTAFANRQRVEWLDQCRQLELILKKCQSANANDANVGAHESETSMPSDQTDIPPSRSRARIARFFKWDSLEQDEQSNMQQGDGTRSVLSEAAASFYEDSDGEKKSVKRKTANTKYSKGCAIETHELWACRALALGCGNHLSGL